MKQCKQLLALALSLILLLGIMPAAMAADRCWLTR